MPATAPPEYRRVVSRCVHTSSLAAYDAVANAAPAGVVAGVVSSFASHDHVDIRTPPVAMLNAALVRTLPGYVYATSPALDAGLLIWIVALFVGADAPTLNVDRYAIDAPAAPE
jgi:hypothetical protein